MSATTTDTVQAHEHESHEPPYAEQTKRNRMGLWLFFFSEIFLFGALLAARFYLWGNTRPELDQTLGVITTSVLLISSFFMVRAETAMTFGDRRGFLINGSLTFILGLLFLIGVVGVEWQGHLRPDDGIYGGIFFLMTGMHALHMVIGAGLIIWLLILTSQNRFAAAYYTPVEMFGLYWHFVDIVWIFLFPLLYLIGRH